MEKKIYMILIGMCAVVFAYAQGSPKTFDAFFVDGMEKIDGVFPVYVAGNDVYLEIPSEYIGREIEIRGQIDRGFDLIGRSAGGLGVVRILSPDEATVCFQQPFYTERILDEKSPHADTFFLSNVQPSGVAYPVVAYSAEQGAIIRITEYLLNREDWFGYSYTFIRSMVSELSKVIKVHPFDEGVSFTVRRYHGAEASENQYSSSSILLPAGSMPLEVTCVLRLLPQKKDRIRLADSRIPYQTIRFKDYSQNPYCMVEDSLILRWDMSRPLTFYVDTLFPKEYFQAVKNGVLAWNEAFRKAGIRNALQVKYLDKQMVSAEQRVLVSYDLKEPGVAGSLTCHPRTGEILSCRIHVGHGFLRGMLDDYLLRNGATDRRIVDDCDSKAVAKELMQGEITKEVGHVLGLRSNNNPGATRELPFAIGELPFKIREVDREAIYFGYHPFSGKGTCYDEREKLRKWVETLPKRDSDRVAVTAVNLSHLQTVLSRLDKIVYKNGCRDNGRALTSLYRKSIRLYATYLSEIVEVIGSTTLPADEQRKAMSNLDTYLFRPVESMDCPYVKENMLAVRSNVLYPELRKLFRKLLSTERISILCSQALKGNDEYDDKAFFRDFYEGLFNGFSVSAPISREQMDYQIICLSEWMSILQKSTESPSKGTERLRDELRLLYDKLEKLSTTHTQMEVRDIYSLLTGRIRQYLP